MRRDGNEIKSSGGFLDGHLFKFGLIADLYRFFLSQVATSTSLRASVN